MQRLVFIICVLLWSFSASAQSFTFDAYLQTSGSDQIHDRWITVAVQPDSVHVSTEDTTWAKRVITRKDLPWQSEIKLNCGGSITLYYDYDGVVESFFFSCPGLSVYSSTAFVRALADGRYQKP